MTGAGERLRRLDDALVGPPPTDAQRAPTWVRFAAAHMGTWFLLLVFAVQFRSTGWLMAALVYGAVEVPAFVAAARWQHRHGTAGAPGRLALFAALPVVIGVAVVTAAVLAPAPWARSHVHYARGCHPAPTDLVSRIARTVHGDFRIQGAVVVGSKDAAVASAVISGTLDVGGLTVPLDRQPADYVLSPGSLAPNNDLARRISPSLQPLFVGGPIGSAWDQINTDRVEAENCALG
jgi:hypothetical protein